MTPTHALLVIGLILVVSALVIVIHELGHALTAKLCGWTCVGIGVVGVFIRWDKDVRLRSDMPRWGLSYVTGVCVAYPKDFASDKRWHYPAYVAGGLAANVVMILITSGIAWATGNCHILALLIQPAAHTVFSLIPLGGSLVSDGTRLRYLLRTGPRQDRARLRFMVEVSVLQGVRPVLTDADYALLMTSRDPAIRYMAYGYRLLQARNDEDVDMIFQMRAELDTLTQAHKQIQSWDPLDVCVGAARVGAAQG